MYTDDLKNLLDTCDKRTDDKLDRALIDTVMPALRSSINTAALAVVGDEAGNPFALYAAESLVIKRLADFLLLTDTDDRSRITPTMLEPTFVRCWFEEMS